MINERSKIFLFENDDVVVSFLKCEILYNFDDSKSSYSLYKYIRIQRFFFFFI